jgi:hypothetical protein
MNSSYLRLTALMLVAVYFSLSGTVFAQASRTWVSGVGDDANPCSRTAPCKTFAGAISKTAPAGEINCLDPGGFGAVTITKAMTISCTVGGSGVSIAGTNGILIDLATTEPGDVTLKGLDINGGGSAGNSLAGVYVKTSGNLTIEDCTIYGFQNTSSTGYGVYVAGPTGTHVLIENTRIRDNNVGVYVAPLAAPNSVTIDHSVIEANITTSLSVVTGATVNLARSLLAGAPTAIFYNGGSVVSFGDNVLRGGGSPTLTLPLQ